MRLSIARYRNPFLAPLFLAGLLGAVWFGRTASAGPATPASAASNPTTTLGSGNWPSFRGPFASGLAEGRESLSWPETWNAETGAGIFWKTEIPGLAHSSPVIWGDRIFVATAISARGQATFRHGLYGDGDASDDRSVHRFVVIALDKKSGKVLWQRTLRESVPREKRHIKSTYANQTPAIDGEVLVVFFGSEGLFGLDLDGRVLWRHDLGYLDVGAYDAPDYEWGSASSPILYRDLAIVQCDTQGEDFLLAVDKRTGATRWRVARDEPPGWATPTIVTRGSEGAAATGHDELVTNGGSSIRGYVPTDGSELWRLGPSSAITAPAPIAAGDLIVVASGRRPEKPIYVLRKGARGDLTLPEGETSSHDVVWSSRGRGPYMPTPIVYGDLLYVLGNNGVLDAYELTTGDEIYRQRLPHRGGGFSGSPVAAGGNLYLPSEDGDILVIEAGTEYRLLATNSLDERVMSTPALSDGVVYVRGERHLFAIGDR
jgi:outer membrane protein assembly factor BamB